VRLGVANQRTVLRILELPPVTDRKELAAAVSFQAQDQVPMPLSNAVLDFHPLGVIDTPAGPRQRVVLVAAQRDMIERLLAAVRAAGLRPEGVDLSAFALIRSLYRADAENDGRVLYLNVDGLTNLAIAEGQICRFTRVIGSGMEGMAGDVAERLGIAVTEARELIAAVDLNEPASGPEPPPSVPEVSPEPEMAAEDVADLDPLSDEDHAERERAMTYEEMAAVGILPPQQEPEDAPQAPAAPEVRMVVERGIRDIAGEVRNSLDFHRSQEGGGDVAQIILSGSALDLPGFAEALQAHLHVDVRSQTVGLADEALAGELCTHRLAVAAGLAATEIHQ
jgi:type IV pilus assembly protein PilM